MSTPDVITEAAARYIAMWWPADQTEADLHQLVADQLWDATIRDRIVQRVQALRAEWAAPLEPIPEPNGEPQ